MSIILYLLQIINDLYQQNAWLIQYMCKYLPLKQWAYDDSYSPKYQKFKTDELPKIVYTKQDWNWKDLNKYYTWRYGKPVEPVKRRGTCDIPDTCTCPHCDAPSTYLYRNNGKGGQLLCKICGKLHNPSLRERAAMKLLCPFCSHSLSPKKERKEFIVYKCTNVKCPHYLQNLKKVDKEDLEEPHGKNKYKLHYIYREFTANFFKMDIRSLPSNASSLDFRKFNSHIMGLCLTMHVNLGLSLRKTSQALKDLYGISISHQMVANYARTAALVIKPFVDNYPYKVGESFTADETYIKVRGVKGYVWFIVDVVSRAIIGYRVSDTRSVGPCIMAMRQAFRLLKRIPEGFRFIADGYSAYPLAAQQFEHEYGESHKFSITPVIGLTNDDAVSKEFRPYKQIIERLNRTFKESYRVKCGYDNYEGANYNVSLWVAYYNFMRPHFYTDKHPPVYLEELQQAGNMPAQWQLLISYGQYTIMNLKVQDGCS